MARTIFYSWQNDLDSKTHRYFIDNCIKEALKKLENDSQVYMDYDRDTMGLCGSPDIVDTIFDKIDKSVLFICDLSIISNESSKKTPNPNVLIELGYAVNKLGWDRIICLFDSNTGKIEDLPFDIRQKRITPYNPLRENEKLRLVSIISKNIESLFVQGKLFNPLNDYMKCRIDKTILDVAKQLANLMFGTISMSEGLCHVRDLIMLDYDIILDRFVNVKVPSFIVLNNFETASLELRNILKELLSSYFFPKDWTYPVIELIEWIRNYELLTSQRNPQFPFEFTNEQDEDIVVISGKKLNESNPNNLYLVLNTIYKDGEKYVDVKSGRVINTTQYSGIAPDNLNRYCKIKKVAEKIVAKQIFKFIVICKKWLDITDSEFILDPDYYTIS